MHDLPFSRPIAKLIAEYAAGATAHANGGGYFTQELHKHPAKIAFGNIVAIVTGSFRRQLLRLGRSRTVCVPCTRVAIIAPIVFLNHCWRCKASREYISCVIYTRLTGLEAGSNHPMTMGGASGAGARVTDKPLSTLALAVLMPSTQGGMAEKG